MTAVAALGLACGVITTSDLRADTFGSGAKTFTIDFVNVGNPGNAAQSASNRNHGFTNGDGRNSVPYEYRVGTYEISQDAITKATAGGMANVTAGAWTGGQPAADISWYEAAAFVNWLNTRSPWYFESATSASSATPTLDRKIISE